MNTQKKLSERLDYRLTNYGWDDDFKDEIIKEIEQLELDAELGRMVRNMPPSLGFIRDRQEWIDKGHPEWLTFRNWTQIANCTEGNTPEEALRKALGAKDA